MTRRTERRILRLAAERVANGFEDFVCNAILRFSSPTPVLKPHVTREEAKVLTTRFSKFFDQFVNDCGNSPPFFCDPTRTVLDRHLDRQDRLMGIAMFLELEDKL